MRVVNGLLISLFFLSPMALADLAGDGVQFTDLPKFNSKANAKWGPVLQDVMNHEAPDDSNSYDDLVTLAHETSHGIHAYVRNHLAPTGEKTNAFYVMNNRAVIVREPKMRKSQVAAFVPTSLRWFRFSTYVTGQTDWDDRPLYLFDEWNAYLNGGEAGVDLVQKGLWSAGWRDAVAGQLEFVVYAIATAMAIQKYDSSYFQTYRQFHEFLAFNIRRSMASFKTGAQMESFRWDEQDKYYDKFRTGSDAESLRQFCRDEFGTGWTLDVLGF